MSSKHKQSRLGFGSSVNMKKAVALQEELRQRVGQAQPVRIVGGSTGTGPGRWVM